MDIAFLGMGRMGSAMARHVLGRPGHRLTVWDRTPERAAPLVAAGAVPAPTPAAAATGAAVVVLMLSDPPAVREVLLGPDGVAAGAAAGTVVVDSSTIGPQAARGVASALSERGLHYVDAPVAGSVGPATAGTLGVLVGGAEADVALAMPLLRLWGDPGRIRHVGPVGAGSALKLVVNLTLGAAVAGLAEALRLGDDLDLGRKDVLAALEGSPLGPLLAQKRTMVTSGDYSPPAFTLDLLAKDLRLAVEAAQRPLPVTAAIREQVRLASAAGHGGEDFAALVGFLTGQAPPTGPGTEPS